VDSLTLVAKSGRAEGGGQKGRFSHGQCRIIEGVPSARHAAAKVAAEKVKRSRAGGGPRNRVLNGLFGEIAGRAVSV